MIAVGEFRVNTEVICLDGIILFIIKILTEERSVQCSNVFFNGRVWCSSWHSSLHGTIQVLHRWLVKISFGVTVQDTIVLHCLFNKADGGRMQTAPKIGGNSRVPIRAVVITFNVLSRL
jgi:hypothetical protein